MINLVLFLLLLSFFLIFTIVIILRAFYFALIAKIDPIRAIPLMSVINKIDAKLDTIKEAEIKSRKILQA